MSTNRDINPDDGTGLSSEIDLEDEACFGGGIDLDCGIAYMRIAGWLNEELALKHENERKDNLWLYTAHGCVCRIQAEPLESRKLGRVALERTRLRVVGDKEALASFERLFTLRFISAGG